MLVFFFLIICCSLLMQLNYSSIAPFFLPTPSPQNYPVIKNTFQQEAVGPVPGVSVAAWQRKQVQKHDPRGTRHLPVSCSRYQLCMWLYQ